MPFESPWRNAERRSKMFRFPRICKFQTQLRHHLLQQRMRPAELEETLRRHIVHRDWRIPGFRFPRIEGKIQGKLRLPSAAFLRLGAVPLVGQKVLHGSQQKRAKPASLLLCVAQVVLFQKNGKKCLRQILRLVPIGTVASNEGVDRMPVDLAQSGERRPETRPRAAQLQPLRGSRKSSGTLMQKPSHSVYSLSTQAAPARLASLA